jgi:hypothetical protein
MKNFVSIALLLIVKVADCPQSLPIASLASRTPDDRQLPVPSVSLVTEPALSRS